MSDFGNARLSFTEMSGAGGPEFKELLRVYEEALPARERKSADALRAMAISSDYRIVVARSQGNMTGFAILLVGRKMALLEYMAVAKCHRGRGIGSALYRRCRDAELPATLPLLIEIDSDREKAIDRELRRRRKQFYRRLGCRQVIGLDYVLPLPGGGAPPMMDLLVDGDGLGDSVNRSHVAAWLREIYASAYGCQPDDSRVLAMLGSLPEEVPLQ